jgi:glycosyltransferase involved in cell wall biosynthesis
MLRRRSGVVHFLHGEHDFHYSGRIARYLGWQTVATFHAPPRILEKRFAGDPVAPGLDAAVCLARNQVEYFAQLMDSRKVHFVPLGVDTEFFSPGDRYDPNLCLIVGQHLRDFPTLRKTLYGLHSAVPKLRVVAVVLPEYQKQLPREPWLEVASDLSDDSLREQYREAAFLLIPLLDGAANCAVVEGLACGVPIVTTKIGGTDDYLTPACAEMCPPGDAEALVEAGVALLTDEAKNGEMRLAARSQARTFDWRSVVSTLTDVYREVGK